MNKYASNLTTGGVGLTVFAVCCAVMLSLTWLLTKAPIEAEREAQARAAMQAIIGEIEYDNTPHRTPFLIPAAKHLNLKPDATGYRVTKRTEQVAIIVPFAVTNGYNGRIEMMIGLTKSGQITGLRVISHKETPGLGDKIELRHSDWILGFNQFSLNTPNTDLYVKKDGGRIDAFTGATITPRAIASGVRQALDWFRQHQGQLFPAAQENSL